MFLCLLLTQTVCCQLATYAQLTLNVRSTYAQLTVGFLRPMLNLRCPYGLCLVCTCQIPLGCLRTRSVFAKKLLNFRQMWVALALSVGFLPFRCVLRPGLSCSQGCRWFGGHSGPDPAPRGRTTHLVGGGKGELKAVWAKRSSFESGFVSN